MERRADLGDNALDEMAHHILLAFEAALPIYKIRLYSDHFLAD